MARQSARLSGIAKSTPAHKRGASATAISSAEVKRPKTAKATPTKSQYFPKETRRGKAAEDVDEPDDDKESSSDDDASASAFDEDEDQSESSDPEQDDDYDSEEEQSSRRKSASRKSIKSSPAIRTKGSTVLTTDGKTELVPGTQLIIKKPKARPAGKTPYTDETIHPNTFLFLKDLKANNNRPWLKMNDLEFRQAEKDWHSFVEALTSRLSEIDDTVPELPVKDVIFRIYRDVRFSPDPTPYKPYFSVAWSRTGRKGPYAHYYLQVAPNDESFVGGGLWHPDAAPTAAMRRSIDRHPERIKGVLMDTELRKTFLKGVSKDEKKVVKAFFASNSESALKTKPKGYEADHPEIELLRLRNYTLGTKLKETELLGEQGLDHVAKLLSTLKPMITFLNSVVMPDEAESEEGSDDESNESEQDSTDA